MFSYQLPQPQTALERFSATMAALMRLVWGRRETGVFTIALVNAIGMRVSRVGVTIQTLMLAMQAGTLRTRRSPAPGGTRAPRTQAAAVPAYRLPRDFAWLVKIMPADAAALGNQLLHLTEDPEMAALLAASPRAVRTLKPMFRMLGVKMPTPPAPPAPPEPPEPPQSGDSGGAADGTAPRQRAGDAPRGSPAGAVRGERGRRWRRRPQDAPPSHAHFVTLS